MSFLDGLYSNRQPIITDLHETESPADHTTNIPWDIPRATAHDKHTESPVNAPASHTIKSIPYNSHWEQSYASGMLLFANKRASNSNAVVTGSIPIVNYYLEEGARRLYMADMTSRKRTHEEHIQKYEDHHHLYAATPNEFGNTWRIYGSVNSIMGKPSGMSWLDGARDGYADETAINCDVSKFARIFDIWGGAKAGDCLYLTIGVKENIYPFFYNPDGMYDGSGVKSPPKFLQVIPVNHGKLSSVPIHNSNWRDLDNPKRNDVDFFNYTKIPQYRLEEDLNTGEFRYVPEGTPDRPVTLGADTYQFGLSIFIGTVIRGAHGRVPSQSELEIALRSNKAMQSLPKIEVALFC